jgi:hypothetical protein
MDRLSNEFDGSIPDHIVINQFIGLKERRLNWNVSQIFISASGE